MVVDEKDIREEAIKVAIETGSSGFDAYVLATALKYNAVLITDDEPMSIHAKKEKLEYILLRSVSLSELEDLI
ncbi:PIN domain-containing protein [Ignicoccus islandicus]|uniref:PIN domain-containing protein n=1 Tax=Ignicoccus islandicus TaxID=54259 RepID=UPI003B838E26